MLKLLALFFLMSSAYSISLGDVHIIGMCRIFDMSGNQLATFPGRRCIFNDDGSFISLGADTLRGFDPDGGIRWEFPVGEEYSFFSHDPGSKTLIVLKTIQGPTNKSILHLLVMSLDGRILHETKLPEVINSPEELNFQIREIPASAERKGSRWLRRGNFLVSGSHSGLLIMSHDLKKVLHTFRVPNAKQEHIAGFVFSPEGTLIILNRLHSSSTKNVPASTVEEYDLASGRNIFRFPEKTHGLFYIPAGGSINMAETGDIILNHPFSGVHVISRKEKKLSFVFQHLHFDNAGLNPPQSIFVKNLKHFRKNWKF